VKGEHRQRRDVKKNTTSDPRGEDLPLTLWFKKSIDRDKELLKKGDLNKESYC